MTALDEKRQPDPERAWEGVVAHVTVPTVDKRVIDSMQWALPLPVTAIVYGDFPSVVGMVREVEIRDDVDVWASGVLRDDRVAAGRHAVGVEVGEVDVTPVEDRTHMDVRLRCLRLYTNSTLKPAWADVAIEVAS